MKTASSFTMIRSLCILILITRLYCIQIAGIEYEVPSEFRYKIYGAQITQVLNELKVLGENGLPNNVPLLINNPFVSSLYEENGMMMPLIRKIDQLFLNKIAGLNFQFFQKLRKTIPNKYDFLFTQNPSNDKLEFAEFLFMKYFFQFYSLADPEPENIEEEKSAFFVNQITDELLENFQANKDEVFQQANFNLAGKVDINDEITFHCNNYKAHLTNLLPKLIADRDLLRVIFVANDNQAQYNVVHLSLAQSDLHKSYGGVSILTLQREAHKVKIVFKPSTVLADFVIASNLGELDRRLGDNYRDIFWQGLGDPQRLGYSFFEYINRKIGVVNQNPNLQIPVYIVFPKENYANNVVNRVRDSYGYFEFITSDPETTDFSAKNFQEFFDTLDPQIDINDFDQAITDKLQKDFFDSLKDQDYRLCVESDEHKALSHLFGSIAGVIQKIANSDFHYENIIFNNKRPYVIDLENSFSIFGASSNPVGLIFKQNVGAFNFQHFYSQDNSLGIIVERPTHELINISGQMNFGNINLHMVKRKKRGFLCCRYGEENCELVEFKVKKEHFLNGVRSVLKIVFDNRNEIVNTWLNNALVSSLIVREVPMPTQNFIDLRREKTKEKFMREHLNELKIQPEESANNFRRKQMIFTEKTMSELETGFIPSFYAKVDQPYLYGSDGQKLTNQTIIRDYTQLENNHDFFEIKDQRMFNQYNELIKAIYGEPEQQVQIEMENIDDLQHHKPIDILEYLKDEDGDVFFKFMTPKQFVQTQIERNVPRDLESEFGKFVPLNLILII